MKNQKRKKKHSRSDKKKNEKGGGKAGIDIWIQMFKIVPNNSLLT